VIHGVAGACALTALFVAALSARGATTPWVGLAVLVVAAGVGAYMLRRHLKGDLIPIGSVFVHVLLVFLGLTAVVAWFF
jgi:hypothetical protein